MSIDPFIYSDLLISQPDKGFRFGMDAVILAWFTKINIADKIIDIGSGSGIIAALLARIKKAQSITAVELQSDMYEHLANTIRLNNMENAVTPVLSDIAEYKPKRKFDIAVCNPPYRPPNSGRVSIDGSEATARFDDKLNTENLLKFCKSYVKYGGRLFFSGPADRIAPAIELCRKYNFEPKRLVFLHPGKEKNAKIFFIECLHGGGTELKIIPPLIQNNHDKDSRLNKILSGLWN